MGGKSSVGLFDEEGKKVWAYAPTLPSGSNGQFDLSVGDVIGDGGQEVAALISAYKFSRGGGEYQHGTSLVILDAEGHVLAQATPNDNAMFVHVCEATGGKGGAILVGDVTGVRRYRYNAGAKAVEPEGAKEK